MRVRNAVTVALAAGALVGLSRDTAHAGDQIQATIVNVDENTDTDTSNDLPFKLLKPGSKIVVKPSFKPGDGGVTMQLIMKNIDCPAPAGPGNDGDKPGKCGVKGSPVTGHVMGVDARALGTDLGYETAGILYRIEKGTAVFEATGKNKTGGGFFGAVSTLVFNKALGFNTFQFHTAASDPESCENVPLIPGNDCTDGDVYAISGITFGNDDTLKCTSDSDCPKTAICHVLGTCVPEDCAIDADCDEGGGVGGTGQCGGETCCDPATDPTCAGQTP